VDLESGGARSDDVAERIRESRSHCAVVAVLPRDGTGESFGLSYDAALRVDSTPYEITAALVRVMERQRLLDEIEQQREEIRRLQARSERLQAARAPSQPVDKIIKAFSRALSSGFDQERLLNLFADTVLEMMRVSKVSVLLQDGGHGEYRVRCFRGLRPDVAEGLRLRSASGLSAWLTREGRIMTRDLAQSAGVPAEVRKEMDILQAEVSVPMLCSGMLAGVLNLNGRVTGSPFQDDELETLFTLAGHMAVAVQDVGALRQVLHQKVYVEQVLEAMGAGVVTINDREEVVTCNRRAAEIIGKAPEEVLRRDLRSLPSPLGDMLYAAMRSGERCQRDDVMLPPGRTRVGVDVYPLRASDGVVLGSAVVLSTRPAVPRHEVESLATAVQHLQKGIGALASEMHEPLARILDAAETLSQPPVEDGAAERLRDTLKREVQRIEDLVGQLSLPGVDGGSPEPEMLEAIAARMIG